MKKEEKIIDAKIENNRKKNRFQNDSNYNFINNFSTNFNI